MCLEAVATPFPQAIPGPVAASAAASPAAPGKVGSEPPGRSGGCLGAAGRAQAGVRDARRPGRDAEWGGRCPRVAHPWIGQGLERRRGGEMGAGEEVSLFCTPTCPFASSSAPVVTDFEEEDACASRACERGSWARNLGGGGTCTQTHSQPGVDARAPSTPLMWKW